MYLFDLTEYKYGDSYCEFYFFKSGTGKLI
jgi:hypothetical protein